MTLRINQLLGRNFTLFLAVSYTIFVTIAFLSPSTGLSRFIFKIPFIPIDKLVHFIIHTILLLLWVFYFWKQHNQKLKRRQYSYIFLSCIMYGIIIELLQDVYVPSRQGDVFDIFANTIGTFVGLFMFFKIKNRITS